ncbi:MAG: acyl transferase [Salegentibacter sp.]|uniref:Acyl-protein synthetase, LuxE n=1 Tax=Salegentibacter flavus TaxID=287099 RepID=A0A1I5ARS7_9FLAO|nr:MULTISPECIES: acyl transferase [Salegentibacter]MDR9456662.1 acyl transferase [Salegentibacter sp.]SFN64909.1 Acyl-protein synthetase, LuxE [Salegentibacter flavus]
MYSEKIFSVNNEAEFKDLALEIFVFQYHNNKVYRQFCDLLKKSPGKLKKLEDIPFLPIEFFKSHRLISSKSEPEIVFTSSGTTGKQSSKHYVTDLSIYEKSFFKAFENIYGNPEDLVILALLPSYLERTGSSLIYMADALIKKSQHPESGFYLNNLDELKQTLEKAESAGKKTLLIGVSFALLDLVERHRFNLKNTIVMETGGMKGRRKEMIRTELHQILCEGFGVATIHSEYGMTELLSQAYSTGDGIFECPSWMKILIRDSEDALSLLPEQKTGGINVIDLANFNSCSFIATQDLGRNTEAGKTEILGRFDNSDIRGCNLLIL